jgi:hypothetical protein
VILADPELHTVAITPTTLFAVAASDGITSAMSNETIINMVSVCGHCAREGS